MKTSTAPQTQRPSLRQNGFTLIELMITVAIIGILASVAYPSYMDQVRKSRRSDAIASISIIQQAQERWRANNPQYAPNIATLGITSPTPGGYYTLAVSTSTGTAGTSYTVTATAVTGKSQAQDSGCTPLTVTVTGGNATNTQPTCWSK